MNVWFKIASFGVLGPYVFEDNEGAAITVTSERYVAMLRYFCEPELHCHGIDLSSVWFQQDGATAHIARASMSVLWDMFPQHVISHGGDVPWPARLLISLPVITFYGGISKAEFSSLSLGKEAIGETKT